MSALRVAGASMGVVVGVAAFVVEPRPEPLIPIGMFLIGLLLTGVGYAWEAEPSRQVLEATLRGPPQG